MKKIIDARGKACPIPVVETQKTVATLHEGDSIEIAVDNVIAVQNLTKMAEQKKLSIESEKVDENHYVVKLNKTQHSTPEKVEGTKEIVCQEEARLDKIVVVLSSDRMGGGDEKLGGILMKGFIYALTEQESLPETILLYNKGAYLTTKSSDSIADLKLLESQGVEILTCGTCLNHYGLAQELAVGTVTNMYVIVEKQMQATKIVMP